MTATITRLTTRKTTKEKQESPYKRLHVIIPIEDMLWASQQKPSVNQLWQECWTSDPYGSRWMPLSTNLGYSSFICAKKILSESGLFIFKPDKSIQDGRETVGWMVRNLHGSRIKEFWDKISAETEEANSTKQQSSAEKSEMDAGCGEMRCKYTASISGKTQSEQGLQKSSRTPQKQLTNSSKEIVSCDSSTPKKNPHGDETAIASLGDASPQTLEGVEEREELPAVTNCTTLTLVDDVPSQPASLSAEKQDLGVEPGTSHEGIGSALSAPEPETQPDKWSSEAIAERSKARPWRMEKLKMAGLLKENPGFDFLMECWQNDPALQIVIKGLLRNCRQWGYVVVDGQLIDWDRG